MLAGVERGRWMVGRANGDGRIQYKIDEEEACIEFWNRRGCLRCVQSRRPRSSTCCARAEIDVVRVYIDSRQMVLYLDALSM